MDSIEDLMAIAVVRRIVLAAGHLLEPGELDLQLGSLEIWIHLPHAGLEGRSPVEVLRESDGEQRLSDALLPNT